MKTSCLVLLVLSNCTLPLASQACGAHNTDAGTDVQMESMDDGLAQKMQVQLLQTKAGPDTGSVVIGSDGEISLSETAMAQHGVTQMSVSTEGETVTIKPPAPPAVKWCGYTNGDAESYGAVRMPGGHVTAKMNDIHDCKSKCEAIPSCSGFDMASDAEGGASGTEFGIKYRCHLVQGGDIRKTVKFEKADWRFYANDRAMGCAGLPIKMPYKQGSPSPPAKPVHPNIKAKVFHDIEHMPYGKPLIKPS